MVDQVVQNNPPIEGLLNIMNINIDFYTGTSWKSHKILMIYNMDSYTDVVNPNFVITDSLPKAK